MPANTIPGRLLDLARARGTTPAYHVREGGRWIATDWATYAAQVRAAAKALIASGIHAGDRVCILGFNRPQWTILDLAAMLAKGASQPWQDTLYELTGTRQMDGSAIIEYFKPLQGWLKQQNQGQHCGW